MAYMRFRLEHEGVYLLLRPRIESQSCVSSMPESVLKNNRFQELPTKKYTLHISGRTATPAFARVEFPFQVSTNFRF